MYQQHPPDDDFILAPPPTLVPTMAETLYGATPYSFPPLYPANDMAGDNSDYVPKYRPHPELFASTRSTAAASSGLSNTTTLGPNPYDPPHPTSWLGWGQQDHTDSYHHHHHQQHQRHSDFISDSAHPPPSVSPVSSSMNGNHSYLPNFT